MPVGLDIGTTSVKVISTQKAGKNFKLLSAGAARVPVHGIRSDADRDLTELSTVIKKLFTETRISSRDVFVGLPESEVVTRVVEMPKLTDQELSSAMEWEAEQYIPMPIAETNLSYEVLERNRDEGSKMKVLLVAAPKILVLKYIKVLEAAGLKISGIETDLLACGRVLAPTAGSVMISDIGARGVSMAIFVNGKIVLSRTISSGGEALTRAIAVGLSMEAAQADEYKKAYGLGANQLEGKVRQALMPVVDLLISEMKKMVEFHKGQSPDTSIKSVVLTGGGAGLPDLVSELAGRLGVEVVIGDPFASFTKDEKMAGALAGYAPLYGTAAGLSIKES